MPGQTEHQVQLDDLNFHTRSIVSCEYIWTDDLYFKLEKPFFTKESPETLPFDAGGLSLQFRHRSGCHGNGNFLS